MLRKLWHRRALCSVRCFKNGFHQTEQNLGHFISHPRPNDLGAVRLPSFSGHPICADLVSVGEDVHCESTAQEVHAGVPA